MERRRAARANDRSPWCPFQETGAREYIEHVLAVLYADVPQAPSLPERQFEAWHLHEIGAYAIDEGSDVHGGDKSNLQASSRDWQCYGYFVVSQRVA
jgi:hypothetical protein